jgi:hypothetical protein
MLVVKNDNGIKEWDKKIILVLIKKLFKYLNLNFHLLKKLHQ